MEKVTTEPILENSLPLPPQSARNRPPHQLVCRVANPNARLEMHRRCRSIARAHRNAELGGSRQAENAVLELEQYARLTNDLILNYKDLEHLCALRYCDASCFMRVFLCAI